MINLQNVFLFHSSSARFLWKRIPANAKTGNVEMEKIHDVYVCLWNNDFAGFFKAINYEWSSSVAEIMFELRGKHNQKFTFCSVQTIKAKHKVRKSLISLVVIVFF